MTARSIRRRRTIDLHFESTSERTQFKTQMTALGCGVLGYLFFGLIAYLLVGELLDVGPRAMKILRLVWFAPVLVYLALQFLVVLARPASQEEPPLPQKSRAGRHIGLVQRPKKDGLFWKRQSARGVIHIAKLNT